MYYDIGNNMDMQIYFIVSVKKNIRTDLRTFQARIEGPLGSPPHPPPTNIEIQK